MARYDVLFAIMALQEVRFFGSAARRLRDQGLCVGFITFHEAGDAMLDRMGFDCFSIHKLKPRYLRDASVLSQVETQKKLGVEDFDSLYRHEMLCTNRTNREWHIGKTLRYIALLTDILEKNQARCVIQELGGFIAPQCLYYVARMLKISHVFIEPSIFNRRIVFTLNDIYCDLPGVVTAVPDSEPGLLRYLREYRDRGMVVMPHKDKHFFYAMALRRIFSADNFSRLTRKLYHKYVVKKDEEYNAIGWYVINHLVKWVRSKRLMRFYQDPRPDEGYVFYPFHVPLDVQLTVRCPEFLDQVGLIEKLAASLPEGMCLYIKEHPAAIGALSLRKLRLVLHLPNVRLIDPRRSSFSLIRGAGAVVSVNSKVGMEALMQGKPVLVLGRAYYRGKGVTVDWDGKSDLSDALRTVLAYQPDQQAIHSFLKRAWQWSYPGELYEFSKDNKDDFYSSLHRYLDQHVPSVFGTCSGRLTTIPHCEEIVHESGASLASY